MSTPKLGIMTLYLNNRKLIEDKNLYARMILLGRKIGIDAFVFTPEETNGSAKKVYAHLYDPNQKKWFRRWVPFPDIIFDRCRYQPTQRFQQLKRFRAKYPRLLYLNRPMANKWIIYQLLRSSPELESYLPETRLFKEHRQLMQLLRIHKTVYVKPINGTGGRGITKVESLGNQLYLIRGRNMKRAILAPKQLTATALDRWFASIRREGKHLLQEGIDIRLPNGRVHDFRVLVQKNGLGQWVLTGAAGRVGAPGSITSNLHGGGKAMKLDELLQRQFNDEVKVEAIKQEIHQFSINVVNVLERKYRDLCEMALDIAIDRKGKLWLLEVNPKPAREVFARIGEKETYRKAMQQPLEYALWLYRQKRA